MTDQQLYQLEKRLDDLERSDMPQGMMISDLKVRVRELEELEARTGLLSKSWFGRAITAWFYVWGIQLVAGLVILLLGLVFGLLGG